MVQKSFTTPTCKKKLVNNGDKLPYQLVIAGFLNHHSSSAVLRIYSSFPFQQKSNQQKPQLSPRFEKKPKVSGASGLSDSSTWGGSVKDNSGDLHPLKQGSRHFCKYVWEKLKDITKWDELLMYIINKYIWGVAKIQLLQTGISSYPSV